MAVHQLFRMLSYTAKHYNYSNSEKRSRAERYYQQLFEDLPIDLDLVRQKSQQFADEIRTVLEPILIRMKKSSIF